MLYSVVYAKLLYVGYLGSYGHLKVLGYKGTPLKSEKYIVRDIARLVGE